MAITQNPLIGKAKGTFATSVFSTHFNKNIVKSKSIKKRKPATTNQSKVRTSFSLVQSLVTLFLPILRTGFESITYNKSVWHSACSWFSSNVIVKSTNNYTIDYSAIKFTFGNLFNGIAPSLQYHPASMLFKMSFADNSGTSNAEASDIITFIFFNKTQNNYITNTCTRLSGGFDTNLSDLKWFANDAIHVYYFITSSDNKLLSNTLYIDPSSVYQLAEVDDTFTIDTIIPSDNLTFGLELTVFPNSTSEIDWGDGSPNTPISNTNSTPLLYAHTYSTAGSYSPKIINAYYLSVFNFPGSQSISFNIQYLPSLLTSISVTGSNTISGNIADFKTGLTYIIITGSNTISGNIADFKTGLTYIRIYGSNTISGNIADFKTGLTYIIITGSNTISGNIADFKTGLTYIRITGTNTISGNIADFKTGLTYIIITGLNTISGNIADFKTGLTYINITGSNTISGNIADFKTGLTYIYITGTNTISDYTSPHAWESILSSLTLNPAPSFGLNTSQIDALLIDLNNSNVSNNIYNLSGNNASRSSNSDIAFNALISRGNTLTFNAY